MFATKFINRPIVGLLLAATMIFSIACGEDPADNGGNNNGSGDSGDGRRERIQPAQQAA